jgi:hypothetical protein
MDEEALLLCGEAGTHGGDKVGFADVIVTIDKVMDDLDLGGGDIKCFASAVAEMVGYRGDAVGLYYPKPSDREVRVIEAHEGDVGSVEGGDEGKRSTSRGQHLTGEERADGVRYGVVNVEEIE